MDACVGGYFYDAPFQCPLYSVIPILMALCRTNAYQHVSSSAAFTEAQSQAKKVESEAYDRATSKVRS